MTNVTLPHTLATLLQAGRMQDYKPLGADTPQFHLLLEQAQQELSKGLPTQKSETFRFAKLQNVFQQELYLPEHRANMEYLQLPFLGYKLNKNETYTLRCINGKYIAPENERLVRLPSGIVYGSLAKALEELPDLVLPYLAHKANDVLAALTTLLSEDGFFLYVPENVVADKPFNITLVQQGPRPLFVNQRNLILLGNGAQAQCNLSEHSLSEVAFVSNATLECILGAGATLRCVTLQNVHNRTTLLNHTYAQLNEKAQFYNNTITLRGGFIRDEVVADLGGQYAELNLSGIALVDEGQYIDNVTRVEHRVPNCTSSQLYKTLIDDGGEYSFFGHIHVHRDAQKTQAYQRNANVLVNRGGIAHTRPQLLIDADDVKCSHGATVGQLDEEAKFYMLTRGIPQKEVTRLLMRAFLQDVISEIPLPVIQEQIETLIESRLKGEKL